MSAVKTSASGGASSTGGSALIGRLVQIAILVAIDLFAAFLVINLARDGIWEFAIFLALVTLFVNVIQFRKELFPIRWISPALVLMGVMVIYPILYTVYVSLTNYSDGNFLTKTQVINQVSRERFLPEGGAVFDYVAYRNEAGEFALLLTNSAGEAFFARVGAPLEAVKPDAEGKFADTIDGFTVLPRSERFSALATLSALSFGPEDQPLQISSGKARALQPRFIYDSAKDSFTDRLDGKVYFADDTIGFFVNVADYEAALAADPNTRISSFYLATPTFAQGAGYRVLVGANNFTRFFTSPAIRGPLLQIFTWTVTFALVSVFSTFALGLLIALLLQADTPAKRVFRTLLIVPYAIPALIAVSTWRGMLNPNMGVIGSTLSDILGYQIPVFSDATWAKVAILLINLWLGYPYFMLVCSGALAAIPSDMYEAAQVDGANTLQQFRFLTLPLLLVSVGPLLIASFTFNFNNFVIIEAFNKGLPPILDTPTAAGQTDILISYAFRLAFGSGRGADFGLASAITIVIFAIVAGITMLQFRFTRQWEETSKNV